MHEHGEGVAKDNGQALQWYRLAAEQGHPLACDKVAHFYDAGLVVEEDKREAVRWFTRALLGGLAQAEHDLARLSASHGPVLLEAKAPPAAPGSALAASGGNEKTEAVLSGVLCAHRSSAVAANSTMQLRVKSNSKERGRKS